MCALEIPLQSQKFKLSANLAYIEPVRNLWENFLKNENLSPKDIEDWRLIFTETLVNAIIHGAKANNNNNIEISWWRDQNSIFLEIIDPGKGPDLNKIQNPQLPKDPLDDHGRGLFIIKQFCDDWQHWISTSGYRQILKKTYDNLSPQNTIDPILEQALHEISMCYESLSAFYRLGEALMHHEGLGPFLTTAINDLKNLIKADFIGLTLNNHLLEPKLYEQLKNLPIIFDIQATSDKLQSLTTSNPEWIWENTYEIANDSVFKIYHSGWIRQLSLQNELLGHSFATRTHHPSHFNAAEINTLRTFSDLFSIAIAQANNAISRDNEQQALKELEIASELQEKLFPIPQIPTNSTRSIFIQRQSAKQVGGDYVDALIAPNGALLLVIVDVMGKGVSAAFLAAMIRTALRINLNLGKTLIELLQTLNQMLCNELKEMTMFATCALVLVDEKTHSMSCVNAGHCPIIFQTHHQNLIEIEPSGPPLGLFEDYSYTTHHQSLEGQETIILVTDGIYEWPIKGLPWGWDSWIKFIKNTNYLEQPHILWTDLQTIIKTKSDGEEATDDQTFLYCHLNF